MAFERVLMLMSYWTSNPLLCAAVAIAIAATVALAGLIVLLSGLQRVFATAPSLNSPSPGAQEPAPPDLTVVIPAFNEAANIARCLSSVLRSDPPASTWTVVVVDDESNDATAAIAASTAHAHQNSCSASVRILQAGPRPRGERWVGKNWACTQAVDQLAAAHQTSEWILFLDADVTLAPHTLRTAVQQARQEQADLFSLAPRLVCSCLAEWMVQPIMASLLGLGFPIQEANNPNSSVAFAAGPFMLFRRQAYEAIGGHRALAGEVVEDLALAQRIKTNGYRLRYCLGLDAVDLQMYEDLASLWEGWSKNWFLGLDRNISKALGAGAVVLLMFAGPWLMAATGSVLLALAAFSDHTTQGVAATASLLGVVGIGLQLGLRLWMQRRFAVPLTHWWLMGAGGLIVAAIAPTSVWRSLTGRGWTWKGRPLA